MRMSDSLNTECKTIAVETAMKKKKLKQRFAVALVALLIAFGAATASTFAWYIYNTSNHTTEVQMAAGSSSSLKISNQYDGTFGFSTVLDSFVGSLNPVSTDKIANGFQKVIGFTDGSDTQPRLVANLFGPSVTSDYYKTSLFLATDGSARTVYLSDIGYEDSDELNPISAAIRVGFCVHKPGKDQPVEKEYIFAINQTKHIENPEYNTYYGTEGHVLDSTKMDGSTVLFTPLDADHYCTYDNKTGKVTLKEKSVPFCKVESGQQGKLGERVQIDVYIWLEGCDSDCTKDLASKTLRNLALNFVGVEQ